MVQYTKALTVICATSALIHRGDCFQPGNFHTVTMNGKYQSVLSQLTSSQQHDNDSTRLRRRTSTAASYLSDLNWPDNKWNANIRSVSAAYLDTLSLASISANTDKNDGEDEEESFTYGSSRTKDASAVGGPMDTYTVSLPINGIMFSEKVLSFVGMSLRQVASGKEMTNMAYNVDSQRMVNSGVAAARTKRHNSIDSKNKMFTLDDPEALALVPEKFEGIIVSELFEGGLAYDSGVRIGDALVATSATIGDKIWPKSTLEGVQSAIQSRRIISSDMKFQFRRPRAYLDATEVVEEFDLTLTRPMGIQVEGSKNGYVKIIGFTEGAEVSKTLRVGDRIVAVESAFRQMWPVSTVEGVVSACTTRKPGESVKLRFQRVVEVGKFRDEATTSPMQSSTLTLGDDTTSSLAGAVDGFRKLADANTSSLISPQAAVIPSTGSKTHQLLLSRSRDLLRRYKKTATTPQSGAVMSAIPAVVADRVLDALATASAPLDSETLAMVMNAYTSCRKADKTIRAFEAAVGVSADGSYVEPTAHLFCSSSDTPGKEQPLVQDMAALDLSTASSLLRAHALQGDYRSAVRVLAAMAGDTSVIVQGVNARAWPLTSKPDVRCYNMVLAAAAKAGGEDGVNVAIDVFERMADPMSGVDNSRDVVKTAVSYNTMIALFAKVGRPQDALTIFYSMKQSGVKPDKYSYTSLLKALVEDGDFEGGQDLFKEMGEVGIKYDVVTYNTMIKGLCDRLQWFTAKELISEMEMKNISPNGMTYGLLMNGLLKADKPGPCLTLFEAACSDTRTTVLMENVQLYTTAITAASKLGNYERAIELVSRMKKVGVKPNLKTLTALMSACLYSEQINYALDVYSQICKIAGESTSGSFKLDGFVLTLALRAHCQNGDFVSASEILTSQKDGYSEMTGKEIMSSYNYLINASLQQREYDVARSAVTELLQSGYIPSKITFENILKGLELDAYPKKRPQNYSTSETDVGKDKLEFLLFILDSLGGRNLQISGSFYAAILVEGVRIGGLGRKMASLLGRARAQEMEGTSFHDTDVAGDDVERHVLSWQGIFSYIQSSSNDDNEKNKIYDANLPILSVRVGQKEARLVLTAESPVVYNARQKQRQFRMAKNIR